MKRLSVFYFMMLLLVVTACREGLEPSEVKSENPDIFPDYIGVTIPTNIAPLNFKGKGDYSAIDAKIEGSKKGIIQVQDKQVIQIPPKKWAQILEENKGDSIQITVSVKQNDKWIQYAPFPIYISKSPMDNHLVYRLIAPGYEIYSKMGIYQRDLTSFKQEPIIENTLIPGSCVNCHSFSQNNPKNMSFHIRGKKGGTILMKNGKIELLSTKTDSTMSKFVYPYWHPSGDYIVYSLNKTKQMFHSSKKERVEVVDFASDLVVYDVKKNQAIACDQLMKKDVFETFPSFSSDGRTLYFCQAEQKEIPSEYKEIRYNLCSISFNPEDGSLGEKIDTLFNASAQNKSVTFPRPSPDGQYIMFTLVDYGNFSIWHKEADLYLYNTETGDCRPISEVNSDDTESYHSWSSNSRWFVFSSRRLNGLYTRPFIASINEKGTVSKPFLLPQKTPDFYLDLMQSFNIPEFVNGRVDIDPNEIEKAVNGDEIKQVEYRKL